MTLRGVLFDATGTLIETRVPVGETYSRVAREFGVDISAWRLGDAFQRIFRQAPPMLFPGESAERVAELERSWWVGVVRGTLRAADSDHRLRDFDAFFDTLYAIYSTPECWRIRPGCIEGVSALRARGLATGVVSNFDHRLVKILEDLGIAKLFDMIMLPSMAGAAKPDPRIFALALEELGFLASDVAFVGNDPERDLSAARKAGMRAFDATALATLTELPEQLGADESAASARADHERVG